MNVTARGGYTGYFLFRCLLRGGLFLYLTKSKEEFCDAVISAETLYAQFNKRVAILRVDAGRVEASKENLQLINLRHISVQPAVSEKQNQNFVKRSQQTFAKGEAAILYGQVYLDNDFWGLAGLSFVATYNDSPNTLTDDMTPNFYLNGKTVDLATQHLYSFGTPVVISKLNQEHQLNNFKFSPHNLFGYVVGSTTSGNGASLIFFPQRAVSYVFSRSDIVPIKINLHLPMSQQQQEITIDEDKWLMPPHVNLQAEFNQSDDMDSPLADEHIKFGQLANSKQLNDLLAASTMYHSPSVDQKSSD